MKNILRKKQNRIIIVLTIVGNAQILSSLIAMVWVIYGIVNLEFKGAIEIGKVLWICFFVIFAILFWRRPECSFPLNFI